MFITALTLNIIHLVYHQLTTNFNFFPFNNVRSYTLRQRLKEASIHGGLMTFCIISLIWDNKLVVGIATLYLFILLVGEYFSWWKHYFFGSTKKWMELYDNIFKDTIIVLPKIKNNPTPNLEHCILHLISFLTFIATCKYYLAPR